MNKILLLLFIICQSCESQTKIEVKINIDELGNISIAQRFDKPIDTLLLHLKSQVDTSQLTFIKRVKTPKGYYNKYLKKKNLATINYKYLIPRKINKNHFITDSVFYFSKNYIAYNSSINNNSIGLKINLPNSFSLINPSNNEYKTVFDSPDIIAGLFSKQIIKGYEVFSLKKHKKNKLEIVKLIDDSYKFFSAIFGEATKKPRIIFMPLQGSRQGKKIDNAILLNENFLNSDVYDIRVVVHEIAHLWWSDSFISFKEKLLTEAFAEFLALYYLKSKDKPELVKELLMDKNYKCEVYNSFSLLNKPQKTLYEKRDLSYSFITLLLFHIQNNDNSFIIRLSDLFNTYRKNKTRISNKEFESFITSFGYVNIFEEKTLLPDIYIVKSGDSLSINSTKNIKGKVPVEFTYTNSSLIDSLDFSSSKKIKINNINLNKIIIDPNFTTIQDSRLNDVWVEGQLSFFHKSSYQPILNTNIKVTSIASQILSYLKGNINIEDMDIDETKEDWVISKLKKIKTDINNNATNFLLDGASINFVKENNNRIEIKLIFYDESHDNSFYLDFKAYTNDNIDLITHITYNL